MNFKKCTSLFLAFLLLVSNAGFAFNVHYCGDEVASVSLKPAFVAQKSEMGCCGKTIEKSHCCKNKTVHFQKKADNILFKVFSFQPAIVVYTSEWKPVVFSPVTDSKGNTTAAYFCDAHAPPLFKLYSQYIFYDKL